MSARWRYKGVATWAAVAAFIFSLAVFFVFPRPWGRRIEANRSCRMSNLICYREFFFKCNWFRNSQISSAPKQGCDSNNLVIRAAMNERTRAASFLPFD